MIFNDPPATILGTTPSPKTRPGTRNATAVDRRPTNRTGSGMSVYYSFLMINSLSSRKKKEGKGKGKGRESKDERERENSCRGGGTKIWISRLIYNPGTRERRHSAHNAARPISRNIYIIYMLRPAAKKRALTSKI